MTNPIGVISISNMRGGTSDSTGMQYAGLVNETCPNCKRAVGYNPANAEIMRGLGVAGWWSQCPSCEYKVRFLIVHKSETRTKIDKSERTLFMLPTLGQLTDSSDFSEFLPSGIQRSFRETVRAHNAEIYGAAAVSARRTLEGIFKNLVPDADKDKSLYNLIKIAKDKTDLSTSLDRLADAIRSGGNIGAHFDEENEPNEEMSKQMIELLGYLIEYLYLLPQRIKRLEDQLIDER